jgi:hypothetical protein
MNNRFIVIPVECPRCKVRQKVHVAARPDTKLIIDKTIQCLNCGNYFKANISDKIVAGPFPV